MILDSTLVLAGAVSAAGAVTGQAQNGAGTIVGTNTVDLGPLALGGNQVADIGVGEPIAVEVSVLTAPTVGTTVKFQLVEADDTALSVNVNVLSQTDDLPISLLPAGTVVGLNVPRVFPNPRRRYFGMRTVNVGAIATLSVFAAVTKNLQDPGTYYKSGFTVS